MRLPSIFRLTFFAFFLCIAAHAQPQAVSTACPVSFAWFHPDSLSARIQNTSGKTIVGLSFYAALADATEHWRWYHYSFDLTRPLREFGWNKTIKPTASKTLSWDRTDLDFEHGGGGAFVLTSVLFQDGSSWESPIDRADCKTIWYNSHKKSFSRPIDLPIRQQ